MCGVTYPKISFKTDNNQIGACNCRKDRVNIANYFTGPIVVYNWNEELGTEKGNSDTDSENIRNREALNEEAKLPWCKSCDLFLAFSLGFSCKTENQDISCTTYYRGQHQQYTENESEGESYSCEDVVVFNHDAVVDGR